LFPFLKVKVHRHVLPSSQSELQSQNENVKHHLLNLIFTDFDDYCSGLYEASYVETVLNDCSCAKKLSFLVSSTLIAHEHVIEEISTI